MQKYTSSVSPVKKLFLHLLIITILIVAVIIIIVIIIIFIIIITIIIIIIIIIIGNGKRTEWSPIRSVIIRVITKSDDRPILFITSMRACQEGNRKQHWHKNYNFREKEK